MVSSCMKDGKMAFYTFFVFEEFAQKANKKCITIGPRFCTFANRNIHNSIVKKTHLKALNIFLVTHIKNNKNNFLIN